MGAVADYFRAIGRTVVTLGDGLAVTFSYLFRRPVTIQYPDRIRTPLVRMLPERSRGMLEVDIERCTGCCACDRACPIDCIEVQVGKDPEGKRQLEVFTIDLAKCMYCGLCVEACPTDAIRHSHEFEGATGRVQNLILSWVDKPRPPAKAKPETPIPNKPLGSLLRTRLPGAWARPRTGSHEEVGR